MEIHTNSPCSEITNPEGQTYENMTPRGKDNTLLDTESIPYTVSNKEFNDFRYITRDYAR